MKISKNAFLLVGVTPEEFINWCDKYNKKSNREKVKLEFFEGIKTGKIYRDSNTGELISKYARGEKENVQVENIYEEEI